MLTLYQFEECPYCAKVRMELEEQKIPYHKENVPRERESAIRKMLFEKSGVRTVPVIEIDGTFIGESDAIIMHLKGMKKT